MNSIGGVKGDVLDEYLDPLYCPIDHNVKHLNLAKIICCAEYHLIEKHQQRNAELIAELYKDGDVILVEYPDTDTIPKDYHQIAMFKTTSLAKKKLIVKGWDSKSADEELEASKQDMYALHNAIRNLDWVGEEALKLLEDRVNTIRPEKDRKRCIELLPSVIDQAGIGMNIYLMVDRTSRTFGKIAEAYIKTFKSRQENLIRNIQQHLTKDNRVFIISGSGHFFVDEDEFKGEEKNLALEKVVRDGVKLFQAFLKKHPYVIFGAHID